tara:strand:+ start:3121 stop:4266 length:1146 start_codon:yes stop_codon:yes gene_type:complete
MLSLLGGIKTAQKSINTKEYYTEIVNYFYNQKTQIQSLLNECTNDHTRKLWEHFMVNKKFIFPINFHIYSYFYFNKHHFEHVFKYISFRYFFYLCGIEKIHSDYPPYILIEPVSSCNLKCPFCFQTDKSFTKKPFMGLMKLDLFKSIVDEADNLGVGSVTLASRGEPTLHKELNEMLKYIGTKKNIFEVKLNTNATRLTESLCHTIFSTKINQVVISADHYEKKRYEELRKNANYEEILKNVDQLYNIRKEYPDSITEIRISGVNYEGTTDEKKFHDFWIKRSDHVSIGNPLERWDTYNNSVHDDINDPCENLWDRMYIWFDGKANPCDADYKSYLSYGSFKENSIKEIWNSKKITEIRHAHKTNERKNIDPCNKCGITFK